jgi:hypothetical protein
MRNKRLFLILVVLTVVFAAGFFIMNGSIGNVLNGARAEVFPLPRIQSIVSAELTNEYGVFLFTRETEGWSVENGGVRYPVNADKMKLLLASLSDMPVRRVLEVELDAYGLETPTAVIRVETDAGRRSVYVFGNPGADANTVFVKNGADTVILTDSAAVLQVTGNLAAYRDKKVWTVDLLNLTGLEYERGGVPVVSCRREGPTEWYMDYPYAVPARHIELTELVADMMGWVVAGYPDPGANLNEAGLEPPLETITLTDTKQNTQKIGFGKINGINRYARLGENDNVVFLYSVDADLSVLSPDTLLFVAPLRAQMDEVTGLSVEQGDESWAFVYDPATGAASWEYGALTSQEFIGVFYRFISMTADGRDAGGGPVVTRSSAAWPIAALSLRKKSGDAARLELLPRDEYSYYMRINGENTPFYINAKRFLSLMGRISELTAQEPNKSISRL